MKENRRNEESMNIIYTYDILRPKVNKMVSRISRDNYCDKQIIFDLIYPMLQNISDNEMPESHFDSINLINNDSEENEPNNWGELL